MQCHDTEERLPPLEQPQNRHVIFIFSSHLRQHSLANEYYRQLPRVYWQFGIPWTRANKQQSTESPLVSASYTAMKVVRVWKASQLLYVPSVLIFRNSTFCRQCVYMLNTYLRTNSELFSPFIILWLVFITENASIQWAVGTVFNKTNYVSFLN